MDAKQVWRAALGELQVSLSPANFETWLRDTQLIDVDEQRFRIAVPNGFAKDWLENRYRSLISQTLARIVGYSVQVEFTIASGPAAAAADDGPAEPERSTRSALQVRLEPGRVGGEGASDPPTASPMPRACRSPSDPVMPTTRCSCTAASASARPT